MEDLGIARLRHEDNIKMDVKNKLESVNQNHLAQNRYNGRPL